MRKLLLLTSLFAIAFVGCKKKKKTNPSDTTTIVAKWKVNKIEYYTYKKGGELDEKFVSNYDPASYFEFKSDKSYTYHIKEVDENDFEDVSGSYSLNGKDLILDPNNGPEKFKIKTLNKTTLTFDQTGEEYEYEGVTYYDVNIYYLTK